MIRASRNLAYADNDICRTRGFVVEKRRLPAKIVKVDGKLVGIQPHIMDNVRAWQERKDERLALKTKPVAVAAPKKLGTLTELEMQRRAQALAAFQSA
jgi:hypothetical protein